MPEVVHDVQHEFWRPPATQPDAVPPAMVEACDGCGTEFMVGARFCHLCGATRQTQVNPAAVPGWTRHLEFLRALEFQRLKHWLGLPMASLVAFFAGAGCLLAAIVVGWVYTVQNFADFQAIQLWRMEWLLAAVAVFVAGILLRSSGTRE
jgi:hypothetical protein